MVIPNAPPRMENPTTRSPMLRGFAAPPDPFGTQEKGLGPSG